MKPVTIALASSFLAVLTANISFAQAPTPTPTPMREVAEELGSLRNSKVAVPMPEGKTELTYFAGAMSDEEIAELGRMAPNLKVIAGLSRKEALERAQEAHGIDASFANEAFLKKAEKLAWVQVPSAGVDRYLGLDPLIENDGIVLTNNRAVHGPAIADHSMAMLLSLTRNLPFYAESQAKGNWARGEAPTKGVALEGKTMLVVGIGGIGSEIAQRAHAFGMRVIGTRRSDTPSPEYIEKVGKPDELLAMLPEADVVALAVPLTPETTGLLDAEAFAAMKKGSYLINISRGKVVDTAALVTALENGTLAGACLDVTEPEPLPKNHALWKMPHVIITPHVASRSEVTDQRRAALFRENMRRFAAGEPLLNVVDKKAGY
ncbi:D-2-hydroxyacid dehydrogenase [Haloferula chungangensis]|uniref:D-2-hydroxyacid dehydrogenase n=1 Tax=Haloferula chungangensis TaxID=1048331 RepID=A0ABW2L9F1_9BACT